MMLARRVLPTILLALTVSACAPDDPLQWTHRAEEREIINGTTTNPNFLKQVGALVVRQGFYQASFCSGTLIAQNLVLTASHCLEKVTPSQTYFYIGTQAKGSFSSKSYPAKSFIFHPKYVKNSPPPGQLADWYDIALVKLTKQVPHSGAKMIRQKEIGKLLKLGDPVLVMGFGMTKANTGSSSGTRMQGFSTLKLIGNSEIWLDKKNGSQKCSGDSGGPSLMKSSATGYWHVVGVASRTGKDCTYGSIETRVDPFLDWIHKYGSIPCSSGKSKDCSGITPKKDKGTTPKKDSGPTTGKALGASCSFGSECKTLLCIHHEGVNKCSKYCNLTTNNCPVNWKCIPLAGTNKGACVAGSTKPTPDGAPPTKGKLGDNCLYNSDCDSGICGSADGQRFCTVLCTAGGTECGDKYECVNAGGGKSACMPRSDPAPVDPPAKEGCAVGGGGEAGAGWLALLLLALALGRRRR